jgi:spermidine synthase
LVYFIVSIALLGFGISGTWLAFGPDTRLARFLTLRRSALGFVLTTLFSSLVIPMMGGIFPSALNNQWQLACLLLTYSITVLPYFLAGWLLGVVYRDHAEKIHSLYFADLIGAGLGCLLVLALLQSLGAIALVLLACALVAAPVFLATSETPARKLSSVAVLAVLAALCLADDAINARIIPDKSKAFNLEFQNLSPGDKRVVELSEWNMLARTDVVTTEKNARKVVMIDGDAWTDLVWNVREVVNKPFDPLKEALIPHDSPYALDRDFESVLVIGSGGGADVRAALRAGAKKVDAVEINPTTARIVKHEYDGYLAGLFTRPGVHLYNEEGRSFVRSRSDLYDVIMINAIDTFAAVDSGAYMLSENYLYTVEAVKDYARHLKPNGVLCITRWSYAGEASRLFAVMLEALHELGYAYAERHIAVQERDSWASTLISPTPFSEEDLTALRANAERFGGIEAYPKPRSECKAPLQVVLNRYAEARAAGKEREFLKGYRFNISPVHDDSPFFFHYRKIGDLANVLRAGSYQDFVRGSWSEFTMVGLLVLTTLALLLFVAVPLMRRGPVVIPGFRLWLLFFCCLGVSFIFVEISLMQRFALFLGHPARSLALVLAALLFFAGVGSHLKERLGISLRLALGLLIIVIIVTAVAYPVIIERLLGQPLLAREIVTVLLVAPLGILLGMPFPTGIHAVAQASRDAVPWMWGVNGGATVLGSIVSIVLAIQLNFTAVLFTAAFGYALALGAYTLVAERKTGGGESLQARNGTQEIVGAPPA